MSAYVKYPRTYHLPWSQAVTNDDKMMASTAALSGVEVVVTEKMDGENTTMYRDHIHARSIDSRHHESREWVKNFWASIAYEIPEDLRICGENVFARHSIEYETLPSYFMGFSVWNADRCFGWDETVEWFELLGINPVPVLYRGVYDEKLIQNIVLDNETQEGYVVRSAGSILISEFNQLVGKYVRRGHVQTDKHWMHSEVVANKLMESA